MAKNASYFPKMHLTTRAIVLCLLHRYTTENVSYGVTVQNVSFAGVFLWIFARNDSEF